MSKPFKDPVFTIETSCGSGAASIGEIILEAEAGNLLGLPGMKRHYRPAVVTFFATMVHLWRRYRGQGEDPATTFGVLAELDLYPACGQPGFMQPAEPDKVVAAKGLFPAEVSWQEADPLFYGIAHLAKLNDRSPSDEDVAYALMAAADRRSVSKTPAGPKWAMVAVLPSRDGRIGSEIAFLADCYDRAVAAELTDGVYAAGRGISDHLPFLLDPDAAVSAEKVAWPHVDSYRPIRMRRDGEGRVSAIRYGGGFDRFRKLRDLPNFEPHLATSLRTGKKIKDRQSLKAQERPLSEADVRAALYGRIDTEFKKTGEKRKPVVERAAAMDDAARRPDVTTVRVCGTGTTNGKTLGYREFVVPVEGQIDGRLTEEMARRIQVVVTKLRIEFLVSFDRLFDGLGAAAADRVEAAVADHAHRHIQQPATDDALDDATDAFRNACLPVALSVFAELSAEFKTSGFGWLTTAAEETRLTDKLKRILEIKMDHVSQKAKPPSDASTEYVRKARHLAGLVGDKSYAVAKTLRGSSGAPVPMAVWKILAEFGIKDADVPRLLPVIRGLAECFALTAHVPASKTSLGSSFHRMRFSEDRIERMLEEGGPALLDTLSSIAHQARSSNIDGIDWSYPAALALADADGAAEACQIIRGKIALSYFRSAPRSR